MENAAQNLEPGESWEHKQELTLQELLGGLGTRQPTISFFPSYKQSPGGGGDEIGEVLELELVVVVVSVTDGEGASGSISASYPSSPKSVEEMLLRLDHSTAAERHKEVKSKRKRTQRILRVAQRILKVAMEGEREDEEEKYGKHALLPRNRFRQAAASLYPLLWRCFSLSESTVQKCLLAADPCLFYE